MLLKSSIEDHEVKEDIITNSNLHWDYRSVSNV